VERNNMDWKPFGDKAYSFLSNPIQEDARINILEGAVRSGKTIVMIPKWLSYIQQAPQGLLLITGVSKTTIFDNVLADLFDTVGSKNYKYNRQSGDLLLFNRYHRVIGAKDEGSYKYLQGKTIAGTYSDEMALMPKTYFYELLNRMSPEGSKLYGTTNPDSPYHYLYTEFINDTEKIKSGMVKTIHFELDDNPSLSDEYKNFIRKAYAGLWYKRKILGLWVIAEGSIYDMFDESRHTISQAELPDKFNKIMIGCDIGYNNPTAFNMIGVTFRKNKPEFWVIDEYYYDPQDKLGKTTSQYKGELIKFIGNKHVDGIYIDPSALEFDNELRSASCGQRFDNICWVNNDVLPGINTVATVLNDDRFHVVREKCPNTIREFESYLWDAKAQKLGEDKPLKAHDHTLDEIRYQIHSEYPATAYERIFI